MFVTAGLIVHESTCPPGRTGPRGFKVFGHQQFQFLLKQWDDPRIGNPQARPMRSASSSQVVLGSRLIQKLSPDLPRLPQMSSFVGQRKVERKTQRIPEPGDER